MKSCSVCNTPLGDDDTFCPSCGAVVQSDSVLFDVPDIEQAPEKPGILWYYFLIYFCLIVSSVLYISTGVYYLSGDIYSIQTMNSYPAEVFYAIFGTPLKLADTLYGDSLIFLGAFAIYTQTRLKAFRRNAPFCVCLFYILSVVFQTAYHIAICAIMKIGFAVDLQLLVTLAVSLAAFVLNYLYFRRRRELFVN